MDDRRRKRFWLSQVEHDVEFSNQGVKLSVKGFREFLRNYHECPYSCRQFAERYGYTYASMRINGSVVKGIMAGTLD